MKSKKLKLTESVLPKRQTIHLKSEFIILSIIMQKQGCSLIHNNITYSTCYCKTILEVSSRYHHNPYLQISYTTQFHLL